MTHDTSVSHAKATIWAAIIGSVGVIIAAWVGVTFGRNQGVDQRTDLKKVIEMRDESIRALQEENKRLKAAQSSSGAVSGTNAATAITSAGTIFSGPVIASTTKEGVRFDLYGCESAGATIMCGVKVVSPAQDREFMLAVKQTGGIRRTNVEFTRGVDVEANDFVASTVSIGNRTNPNNGQLRTELTADLPTPVVVTFDGARPRGGEWSLFELWGSASHPFRVQFHKVPIRSIAG